LVNFGAKDGSGTTYDFVSNFSIEVVGFAPGGAEDSQLVGGAGERVDLSTEWRRMGAPTDFLRSGSKRRSLETRLRIAVRIRLR
jgi:hypothetical protein